MRLPLRGSFNIVPMDWHKNGTAKIIEKHKRKYIVWLPMFDF